MEYDPDQDGDETAHDTHDPEDTKEMYDAFQEYCDGAGPEALVGVHVGNETINGLPLQVGPDDPDREDVGEFMTLAYNVMTQLNDDQTVFHYATETEEPVSGLGRRLDQETVLFNSSELAGVGSDAYGAIINDGRIEPDRGSISTFGIRSVGRLVNRGVVEGDMGHQSMGVVVNENEVDGRLGTKQYGVVIQRGTGTAGRSLDDDYGGIRHPLYVDVTGDGGPGLEIEETRVRLDIPAIESTSYDDVLDDYLEELGDLFTETVTGELFAALEELDPTYHGRSGQRVDDWLYERMDEDGSGDVIDAFHDRLLGLEPNPGPAIAATVEAIRDDRLDSIDLDAGPWIHDTVRLVPEDGDEPIDLRSYLAWQRAADRDSDERYAPPRTMSAFLDQTMGDPL